MLCLRFKFFMSCFLIFLSCSFVFSGVYTFTNADGANSNWSNPANWDGGILPVFDSSCIVTQKSATAVIDSDVIIKALVVSDSINSDVILSGTNKLNIVKDTSGEYFIENYCHGTLFLQGLYDFDVDSGSSWDHGIIKNMKWDSNLTFDTNSVSYFRNHTYFQQNNINMFGEIKYAERYFKLESATVVFGEGSINNCWMPIELNLANVTVNTTNLMSSGFFRTTWNSTLTINADDSLSGNPLLNPDQPTTYNINGNTEFGMFDLAGNSIYTIILNLGEDVEYLTFQDTSSLDWEEQNLQINGFSGGVVRFGTDRNGLTDVQLSKIVADGEGEDGVVLDSNGWLIPTPPAGVVLSVQ